MSGEGQPEGVGEVLISEALQPSRTEGDGGEASENLAAEFAQPGHAVQVPTEVDPLTAIAAHYAHRERY